MAFSSYSKFLKIPHDTPPPLISTYCINAFLFDNPLLIILIYYVN